MPLFLFTNARILVQTMQPIYSRGLGQAKDTDDSGAETLALEFRDRLKRDSQDTEAISGLGEVASLRGMWPEAIQLFRQSLRSGGETPELLNSLGCAYAQVNDWDNAVRCFQRGIEVYPGSALCFVSLAYKRNFDHDFDAAEQLLQQAIQTGSHTVEAEVNLANLYREWGRLASAIDLYQKLIQQYPTDARLHDDLGRALLQAGQWTSGWNKYEYRLLRDDPNVINSDIKVEPWRGQSLEGKHLLVVAEQGVGDEVQAASCYKDAIHDSMNCTFACDPRLESVFRHSFPQATFLPVPPAQRSNWNPEQAEQYDFYVTSSSLFQYFRPGGPSRFGEAYLSLPPYNANAVESIRQSQQRPDDLRVGISWFGGVVHEQQRRRSIPWSDVQRLLSIDGVQGFCLQHGCQCERKHSENDDSESARVASNLQCDPNLRPLEDLESWFELMNSLDLVISVDNSNVHFAGAFGIPTWALLSESVNWRWPLEGSDSRWYRSVRLFHKSKFASWNELFDQVVGELRDKVRES